jgi:hypothetical protein
VDVVGRGVVVVVLLVVVVVVVVGGVVVEDVLSKTSCWSELRR